MQQFSVISDAVGYSLMKRPDLIEAAYLQSPLAKDPDFVLGLLRTQLPNLDPTNYRGIERCPLAEDARAPIGWAGYPQDTARLEKTDKKARDRFCEFLGAGHVCQYSPCSRIATLGQAIELLSLVDSPSDYEIVRLTKAFAALTVQDDSFLGFDIGYWGGGNFSILCDTAIWPFWHPPDETSLPELAKLLAILNENMLFPTYQSAARFRDYYRLQQWSETEDPGGDFSIILLETPITE